MTFGYWLCDKGREIVKCMNHWYLWHFGIPNDFLSSWGRPPSYEPIHNGMMNLAIGALPRIAFSLFCDLITVEVWSTWKAVCYFKKRPLKLMNDTRNCAQKKPKKSCYPRNFMTPHCVHKLTMFFFHQCYEKIIATPTCLTKKENDEGQMPSNCIALLKITQGTWLFISVAPINLSTSGVCISG